MTEAAGKPPASRKRRGGSGRGGGKVTLAQVSQATGVSTATVSRALNTPDLVSDSTRQTIRRALEQLGYGPSGTARALRRQSFRTIGAIVPSLTNGLSARVLAGFQRAVGQAGYDLLLASFEEDSGAVRHLAENFVRRDVDALFLVSAQADAGLYGFLQAAGIPFVTSWMAEPRQAVPFVAYDHRAAAVKPARYLIELGHRDIALITGRLGGNIRVKERHDSVREALHAHGIALPPERVVDVGTYDLASARRAFQALHARGPLPTAVIASNDIIAAGVLLECHAIGVSVPADLSVTGFGNLDLASQFSPAITTVQTPRGDLGKLAAEYLIRRIQGNSAVEQTRLDVQLIVRESTSTPRVAGSP